MTSPLMRALQAISLATALMWPSARGATAGEGTITALVPPDVGADGVFEAHGSGLALPGLTATLLLPVLNPDGSIADFDRRPLGVVSVTDDRVTLRLKSARAGDAYVLLSGTRGGGVVSSAQPLRVHAPEPSPSGPAYVSPRGALTVAGAWFGARGTLRLGGVRARITAWADDAITALVPASLTEGVHGAEIANEVGRAVATGVVELSGGRRAPTARVTVRERGAARRYHLDATTYTEATGTFDLYASRSGPLVLHTRYWETTSCWPFWCPVPHHATWSTQRVWDVRLTATGVAFDPAGRAVATAAAVDEGSHVHTIDRRGAGGRAKAPVSDLVVLLRREPDGALLGSFSGQRGGRLVEGCFRSRP